MTNRIGLSLDGTVLYHSDSSRGVWAHDYVDGQVSGRRLLVQRNGLMPDGLAIDEATTVWVADGSGSRALRGLAAERLRDRSGRRAGAHGDQRVLGRAGSARPVHRDR